MFDKKTGKTTQITSKTSIKGKNQPLIFSLPLLVKEHTNLTSGQCVVMHLVITNTDASSGDDTGFFPHVRVEDILKSKDAEAKVMEALKTLQRFNVWLEAAVTLSPDGLIRIHEATQLKSY